MPDDKIAQEIIAEWGRIDSDSSNTMALYQSVADHFFQRENAIISTRTPGEDKSLPVLDPTGRKDLEKMAAGMSAVIIPNGQFFFRLAPEDTGLGNRDDVRAFLNICTQIMHSEMFKANFVQEFNEYLMSLIGFGTGNLFCGWDKNEVELYFKDWDIANYRFGTDYKDRPNRCLIRWNYTAEQAYEVFGDKAGKDVIAAAKDPKKAQEKFAFIWRCRKRKNRDTTKSNSLNYRYEEIVINEKEKAVVSEEGHQRFPYHICRWMLSSQSIWGHGQGTLALSADKELQRQKHALLFCADMHNTPPYIKTPDFEGTPKIYPGAANNGMNLDCLKPLDAALRGNFPITTEIIHDTREVIHDCFYMKVFGPLDEAGDRMTRIEVIERVQAGYMQLILPCTRIYNEGLTPIIIDVFHHLLENGKFPPLPPELQTLKIDYLGRLALALQEQQADALQRFAQFSLQMEPVVPNFTADNINVDRAGRRMATVFGVNEGDLNTIEERDAIRQKRAQTEQQQQMMMAAQAASKSYKDSSGAAEKDSPAEALMAQVGGG
ncbi:MAG: portal protein [Phycisphaerae bacterium]|jgi:hypothetical protein|nr:portal protein [Phycisphaerae bacterium]